MRLSKVIEVWMLFDYNDVIMSPMTSQITSLTIIYSTVYSGADQRKHQSSASLHGLCEGNSPAQRASYAKNVSIWWRHHAFMHLIPFSADDVEMEKLCAHDVQCCNATCVHVHVAGVDHKVWCRVEMCLMISYLVFYFFSADQRRVKTLLKSRGETEPVPFYLKAI